MDTHSGDTGGESGAGGEGGESGARDRAGARPAEAVSVASVRVARREMAPEGRRAFRELFGLERLPLAQASVQIELKGAPTAVASALRRAAIDEMPGRALRVPPDGFDIDLTTEAAMLPQFVNQRIELMPLRPQIPASVVAGLRLALDVTNGGTSARTVYSGDLAVAEGEMPEPLFNPTFQLATLQPGRRIVIRGIRIETGYGRDQACFNVIRCGALRPLDVPQYPEADTHDAGGAQADNSGYKVSCLVANPRHHVVTAIVPAASASAAETLSVFVDACANVRERLQLIRSTVERRGALLRGEEPEGSAPPGARASRGVQYTVVGLESGLTEGILQVPGETHTIGKLLERAVVDLEPNIANVSYEIVSHENRMTLTLRHTGDVTSVLLSAIRYGLATFDAIQRGIQSARV